MELKGKQLSLGAKLAAVFFVVLCFVVMLVTKIVIPMNDVIKIGIFIALVFSPVDISLWLEKLPQYKMPHAMHQPSPARPLQSLEEQDEQVQSEN